MSQNVPRDLRHLASKVIEDPQKRLDFINALDSHMAYLKSQNRHSECDPYLEDTRSELLRDIATADKNKSRKRFTVVATMIAPAFVTFAAQVLTNHMPFG